MCIFFGRKNNRPKSKKNAFIGAENEKENEIRSASTYYIVICILQNINIVENAWGFWSVAL